MDDLIEKYKIREEIDKDPNAVLPAEAPVPSDPNDPHELRDLLVDYLRDALVALRLKQRGLATFLLNRAEEIQPDHMDIDLGRRKAKAIRPFSEVVRALSGPDDSVELPKNFAIVTDKGTAYTVEYFEECGETVDPAWLNRGV